MPASAQDPYAAFSSPVAQAAAPAADPYASFSSPVQARPSLNDSIPVPGALSTGSSGAPEGFTDEIKRTGSAFVNPLIGAAELGASGITNIGGKIAGGLSGLVQGAGDMLLTNPYNYLTGKPLVNVVDSAADRSRSIKDALTYQPGRRGQELIGGITQGVKGLYGKTGLPTLTPDTPFGQTFAPAVGDALASLSALPKVGSGVLRAADAATIGKPKPFVEPVPTSEDLRAATTAAYKRANESGALVPAEQFAKVADEIAAKAKTEAVDPVLHPKTSRLVQILQERKGKDLTLEEAENIRRIGLEAEDDVNQIGKQTADGHRAGKIVDALDDKIDALSVNDEARALNRRKMNSQTIDWMIERAQNKAGANYTQAGMENALRQEFKSLANNQQRINRFSPEQKAAIQKVARGGPIENTLRALGKFDPTAGAVPFIAGAATGGAMMLPGFFARRAATRATVRNVDAAREALVGRGLPQAQPTATGRTAANPAPALPQAISAPVATAPRSATAIRSDLRQLHSQIQNLRPEDAGDLMALRAMSARWKSLQAELAQAGSRASRAPSKKR